MVEVQSRMVGKLFFIKVGEDSEEETLGMVFLRNYCILLITSKTYETLPGREGQGRAFQAQEMGMEG